MRRSPGTRHHARSFRHAGVEALLFGILTVGALLSAGAQDRIMPHQDAASAVLDPALVELLTLHGLPSDERLLRRLAGPHRAPGTGRPGTGIAVLVRGYGDIPGLIRRLGGSPGSQHGTVVTGMIPMEALPLLAADPAVSAVEASRTLSPDVDRSVPAAGAAILHAQTDPTRRLTGRGVIIGFTDSGINTLHPAFRLPDGRTRILAVWDQGATGVPPPGFTYGALHDSAAINAGSWWQLDLAEHGTHVAGIAAGGEPGHAGMAPEAGIVMVCNRPDDLWSGGATTVGTLDAYDFIRSYATARGMRHVINTSQSTNLGPHDGTSLFEQALDADVATGSIICVAAGNEAGTARHASAVVPPEGEVSIGCQVRTLSPADTTAIPMEIWYRGEDRVRVRWKKTAGTSASMTVMPGSTGVLEFDSATVIVTSVLHSPLNGSNVIRCTVVPKVPLYPSAYLLTVCLEAAGEGSVPGGGRADLWWERTFDVAFLDHVDGALTVGMPGCATGAITAGSCVNDATGRGALSVFSAHGPRRDGVLKPELVAPGEGVVSARPGGGYRVMSGTSMASPHVAGAVALMLEQDPLLTPADVRDRLCDAAVRSQMSEAAPDPLRGHGTLDAWYAVHQDLPRPGAVSSLAARQNGADAVLTWTDPPADRQRTLRGVIIERDGFRIDTVDAGTGIYQDVMPGAGRHTYRLLAVWSDGWTGAWSAPVSVEVFLSSHPWLLVDDDAGLTYERFYLDAVHAAGYDCDRWNTMAAGPVSPEALLQYVRPDGGVIWFCGVDHTNTLTQQEQTALAAYLDAGGRLLISAQDIGYALVERGTDADRHFYEHRLKAALVMDGTGMHTLSGDTGSFLGGLRFMIAGGDGADNQMYPSAITPIDPARPILWYLPAGAETDAVVTPAGGAVRSGRVPRRPQPRPFTAALAFEEGPARVIYCAFGFEAIASASTRAEVMRRMLFFLTGGGLLRQPLSRTPGWSMRSIPLRAPSMAVADLFPGASTAVQVYEGAEYRERTDVACGAGFWLHDVAGVCGSVCGDTVTVADVAVQAGWNLVAPFHRPVPVSGLATTPPGIIQSPFYGYDRGYRAVQVLEPGFAYWVRSRGEGLIHMHGSASDGQNR